MFTEPIIALLIITCLYLFYRVTVLTLDVQFLLDKIEEKKENDA